MRPPRSSSRINLRFKTLAIMDEVELAANMDGLNLQNWLRRLVHQELQTRKLKPVLLHKNVESLLTIQAILEQLVDESAVRSARYKARSRLERLELQTQHQ